jgi:ABC-type glycerol-3-phosphate transport system substrate-binding protein
MALPLGVSVPDTESTAKHPSLLLLNLAAPLVLASEKEGALFDADTLKPRITSPGFVEAMTNLPNRIDIGWQAGSDFRPVPVIGYADKLIAVTTSSHNAASAFNLITWLASPDVSAQLAAAGERVGPARKSVTTSSDVSTQKKNHSDDAKFLNDALSAQQFIVVPRIPGIDEYMAALDDAVDAVSNGQMKPQEALDKASHRWEQITNSHGREAQKRAYLKHLGISGQ